MKTCHKFCTMWLVIIFNLSLLVKLFPRLWRDCSSATRKRCAFGTAVYRQPMFALTLLNQARKMSATFDRVCFSMVAVHFINFHDNLHAISRKHNSDANNNNKLKFIAWARSMLSICLFREKRFKNIFSGIRWFIACHRLWLGDKRTERFSDNCCSNVAAMHRFNYLFLDKYRL